MQKNLMFAKFFRPKWQSQDPVKRQSAVENLSTSEVDILKQIACSDTSLEIQQIAFVKITEFSILADIVEQNAHFLNNKQSVLHYLKAVDAAGKLDQSILFTLNKQGLLIDFISISSNDHHQSSALNYLSSNEDKLKLLEQLRSHSLRKQICEQFQDIQTIKSAYEILKIKDKGLAHYLKEQIQQKQAAENQKQLNQEQARRLLAKLNKIQQTQIKVNILAEEVVCKDQFNTLKIDDLDETLRGALQASMGALTDACQLLRVEEEEKAQQEKLKQQTSIKLNVLISEIHSVAESLKYCLQADLSEVEYQLNQFTDQLHQHASVNQHPVYHELASAKQSLAQAQSLKKLHEIILSLKASSLLNKNQLNDLMDELQAIKRNPLLTHICIESEQHLLKMIDRQQQDFNQSKQRKYKLLKLAADLEQELDANRVQVAEKIWHRIQHINNQLLPVHQQQIGTKVKLLNDRIQVLVDWKTFSTDPIRESLCEKMTLLKQQTMSADDRAKAIKQLQEKWRELGYNANEALWDKFQSLSTEAYAICEKAFEEEKKLRLFNGEQRLQICLQLESFVTEIDWVKADYRSLDHFVQKAINEWKQFSPVERSEYENLQNRFNQQIDLLKQHINAHKEQNLQKYILLLEKAKQLPVDTDLALASQEYKDLMEQWKVGGMTFQKKMESLWQAFRTIGQSLHEARVAQSKKLAASNNATLDQIDLKVKELDTLINKIPKLDRSEAQKQYSAIKKYLDQNDEAIQSSPRFRKMQKAFVVKTKLYQKVLVDNEKQIKKNQLMGFKECWQKIQQDTEEQFNPQWVSTLLTLDWQNKLRQQLQDQTIQTDLSLAEREKIIVELAIYCKAEVKKQYQQRKMQVQIDQLQQRFQQPPHDDIYIAAGELLLKWFSQPVKSIRKQQDEAEVLFSCLDAL